MPWFPDFIAAAELARRDTRAAGQSDPVAEYLGALTTGDVHELETVWPGKIVIHDPRAGEVRGHRELRHFVKTNQALWAERHATTERVAATRVGRRAVVEMVVHLASEGEEVLWPLAVVAESPNDQSVAFRTYCSQWPVDGHRHLRGPILEPARVDPVDVVGRYLAALDAGDAEAVVSTFSADGTFREPIGPHASHRGAEELRAYFTKVFSAGGGIGLQDCVVTDDGVRCALEYNLVRWGSHELPPQAGIAVFERDADGLLSAARVYDDVEPPAERS